MKKLKIEIYDHVSFYKKYIRGISSKYYEDPFLDNVVFVELDEVIEPNLNIFDLNVTNQDVAHLMKNDSTKVILTSPCIGKSYIDSKYSNVYDFDKHTLDYKWERKGFEHLSDEEFKGVPNRIMKHDWLNSYCNDMYDLIKSKKYDIVTGMINEDLIQFLKERNIQVELILLNPYIIKVNEMIKNRALNRGNSNDWIDETINYVNKLYHDNYLRTDLKISIISKPIEFDKYLVERGFELKT